MDLPVRYGKYELIERIARGGMAEVFLARALGPDGFEKRLVIKRILPELANNAQVTTLFIQEAKVSAGLAHPNIVAVYELGRVADEPYIAMEYIHGRDLARVSRTLREARQLMPAPLAVYCVASALRGLAYAHARADAHGRPLGLVHRDVSPQNILVTFQGEVKLVDFGIAHLEAGVSTGRAGKQAYMAPEQARESSLDGRADVFSAGLVLYELLTGQRPWAQMEPEDRLRALLETGVPDPRPANPGLSDELWEVLRRMLAADPATRPTADIAEEDLRAWLFSRGHHVDASMMSAWLRELFEDDDTPEPGLLGVAEMAREITRLAGDPTPPRPPPRSAEGPEPLPGEVKPVVVLVGEISGLTQLSLEMGTEDLVRRHFEIIRRVRRVVEQHGGVLNRYLDDVFVAFWGVRRTDVHDVDRALAASGALQRCLGGLASRGLPLGLSVGIHRGELAFSRSRRRPDRYLARGDTMKLAQRLAALASPGQALVSEAVAACSGERFAFSPGPPVRARGDGEGCRALQLVGRRTLAEAGTGRWQRRGDELEQLGLAFSSLARGAGGVLIIRGDPGMGKSRLVREVQELARPRGVPFYAGRAEPFAEDLPFTPFRDLLSGMLGLEGGPDRSATIGLDALADVDLSASDRALLRALYAAEPGAQGGPSPEALFATSARLVRGLAGQGPVVLALEDVQHLDLTERALLAHVIRACQGEPVLFLLTTDRAPSVELGPPTWEIRLEPLPRDTQARIVAELLAVREVDEALLARLAETAEGNALYLTELVNALQGSGRVQIRAERAVLLDPEGALGLPVELEGLLAARVDALEPPLKAVLQVASVLGLSFPAALLAKAAELTEPELALQALGEHGLLVSAWPASEGRVAFASPLVWEIVRRGILDGDRRELHGRVADAILALYADNLDPHRQALATHSAAASRPLDAARHAGRLGELLIQQQLLDEAASWWEQGLSWLEEASREEREAALGLMLLLRLHAGEARALLGDESRALAHLEVALDLAEDHSDRWLEARALLALARLYHARGEPELASAHLGLVQPLCRRAASDPDMRAVMVEALEQTAMIALDAGQHREAQRACEEALDWAGQDDTLAARALLGAATALLHAGREAEAMDVLARALERAEAAGDRILSGRITNNMGIALLNAGRYPEALERFRRALDIREGLGYRRGAIVNLHNIGDAHLRAGEPGRAWAAFEQSRVQAAEIGWERGVVMNDVYLAFLEGMRAAGAWRGGEGWDECTVLPDQAEAAAERLRRSGDEAARLADLETSVNARGLLGRLLLQLGRADDAARVLRAALSEAERMNARALARDVEVALEPLVWSGADAESAEA